MNVASLELCKELYELSGWEDGARLPWYCWIEAHQEYDIDNGRPEFPAYELGYLLRKIKNQLTKNQWLDIRVNEKSTDGYVGAYGTWEQGHLEHLEAAIPEDAAARLAIELFKQGILEREDN